MRREKETVAKQLSIAGHLRKRTRDRRCATGEVRQDTLDRRRETGDVRQET